MTAPLPRSPLQRVGDAWVRGMRTIRPAWLTDDVLRGTRWGLTVLWVFAFCRQVFFLDGIPFLRSDLLLWIAALLFACSIGKRSVLSVLVDFLPFAAVLVAYDYLRGFADTMGMPTWWHPQVDVDDFLFGGTNPTVWLQEHLKHREPTWYDVVVAVCYMSFFFLPYVTAGVMWLRSRVAFYGWSLRFVTLSFLGFAIFAVMPTAPPWAAAKCTDADVAGHPHAPQCMGRREGSVPGNLLGGYDSHLANAQPFVQRISFRGFYELHLDLAASVIRAGQVSVNAVAAVPSLHCGGVVLFALFMWSRVRPWWRPVLVAFPLLMAFSLVYSAEHYVSDCLAGALVAALVHLTANRIERRRRVTSPEPPTDESPELVTT